MNQRIDKEIKILIVDDHGVVRQGLRGYLDFQPHITVVGEAANGEEALELAQLHLPDVVLMDLIMPKMDGITATRRLRTLAPETKVIILTSFADEEKVFPALKAGAVGYLLKDVSPQELVAAIHSAHQGKAQLHPAVTKMLVDEFVSAAQEPAPADLTHRELEILRLIANGLSNQEIAQTLTISYKTVKTHVSRILSKLHLADRTQAAIYALKNGIVSED